MGVNFVIVIANVTQKTQEEINKEFGVVDIRDKESMPQWLLFDFKGKSYASWQFTPRYFVPEEAEEKWEALRKYLVRIRQFFGGGKVMVTNDVLQPKLPPEEGEDEDEYYRFHLPWRLEEEDLAEPDYERHRELEDIKELEGLIW